MATYCTSSQMARAGLADMLLAHHMRHVLTLMLSRAACGNLILKRISRGLASNGLVLTVSWGTRDLAGGTVSLASGGDRGAQTQNNDRGVQLTDTTTLRGAAYGVNF